MKTRAMAVAMLLALAGLGAGCQAEKQRTWDYGRSFHTVFENQKLNPQAGDGSPVVGMDGQRAASAYERYVAKAPAEAKKQEGMSLTIGGATASQSGQ